MTRLLPRLLTLIATFAFSANLWAASEINTTFFGNLAIEGYDPVAYFKENMAVEGDRAHEYEWNGANWRFSSAENLALFKANPQMYAPQYGGYCAYAVAQDDTAGIEPDQFSIVDGKLYLNYNAKIQAKWVEKRDTYIEAADKNWPGVIE